MAGGPDEPGVLVMRDGKPSDEKLADVYAVNRPLVFLGIRGAHQEIASRDTRQIRGRR
jgi:hypothetical protein